MIAARAIVLFALAACHRGAPPDRSAEPILVRDLAAARGALGEVVDVAGTARDAKIAAAIERGDLLVYCLGVARWPDRVSGTAVRARGTLELTDEFAAATSPSGEVSAGTGGAVLVLRGCSSASAP